MSTADFISTPPRIDETAFIAPGAVLMGAVTIAAESSVWFGAVIRADEERIDIGARTNIQDGCILHVDRGQPCRIGSRVTLGHGAIVHGATVEDEVLIGIRATVLSGARIGRGSVIAAGTVIPPGTIVPPDSLVMGVPGKVVRPCGEREAEMIRHGCEHYGELGRLYRQRDVQP
jgi:carbonic anhydrase/acetyltransferase-like protein (isoleucine patch superfamily)